MSDYQDVLDALPDAVVVARTPGVIEYLNPAAEKLTGWSNDEAGGRRIGEVIPLRDAAGFLLHERFDPFRIKLNTVSRSPEREYLLHTRDDEDIWVAVRASYQREESGAVVRVVASLRDMGRRRRLDRAKSDLISTVSHEIRSPLTSVKGFTSTLLHRWDRFNDDQKRHMLRTINSDADRVTRLLTDLLDVARLEAGRLELRRQLIDIPAIAKEVNSRLQIDHPDRPLTSQFSDVFPEVMADPGKIEQVIHNLVENAIKYAGRGSVEVTGDFDAEVVSVSVTDHGEGIDPLYHQHLFTKFYRRSGERTAGTGLGLYICKGIVQAHGGEIAVERSDVSGTVFTFTLSRKQDPS
ncbi:MAG: PAS domain-containing sensor histidine kinase [Actinomycetota bacterium]